MDDGGLPPNWFLVEIEVPGARDAIPAGHASVGFGSSWLRSVIVPEEWCALINPQHPLAAGVTARVSRRLKYHRLFQRG